MQCFSNLSAIPDMYTTTIGCCNVLTLVLFSQNIGSLLVQLPEEEVQLPQISKLRFHITNSFFKYMRGTVSNSY